VWESINNLSKVVPEWGERGRGRNLDVEDKLCVPLLLHIGFGRHSRGQPFT
jgi:hypothetical protein